MCLKIRCDGESEKFCKIFWELNKASGKLERVAGVAGVGAAEQDFWATQRKLPRRLSGRSQDTTRGFFMIASHHWWPLTARAGTPHTSRSGPKPASHLPETRVLLYKTQKEMLRFPFIYNPDKGNQIKAKESSSGRLLKSTIDLGQINPHR